VSGWTNVGSRDPGYVRAFRFAMNADRVCEMHIKGSPSAISWHGVNSIAGAPGFTILTGLPSSHPLNKRPTKFKIIEEYLKRLDGDLMKKYCNDNMRGVMHGNLMTMARTLVVPSFGPLPPADFAKLPASRRFSMAGYGEIETIGEPTCVSYVVSFRT